MKLAKGFLANGVRCGLKREKRDLALIYSEIPAIATGVFTRNCFKAAPVIVSSAQIKNGRAQAIIVNSGNANCCAGPSSLKDAKTMVSGSAKLLGISTKDVLVASTGVIGRPLPIKRISSRLPGLVSGLNRGGWNKAAEAIMTTDTKIKMASKTFKIGSSVVTITGMAKGAGMIHPDMATMLAFIVTDANIDRALFKSIFKRAVDKSFNAISVDGDTSTNDCALGLANGAAKNKKITYGSRGANKFSLAMDNIMVALAKEMVKDAEGATKFIEIEIKHARSSAEAKKVANRLSTSLLFKTAVFGEDPNWGRIVAAIGSSGVKMSPQKVDITINGLKVVKGGLGIRNNVRLLREVFSRKELDVTIDLKDGSGSYLMWTSDISTEYVKFNAEYAT
ncbi:MAG: bifunctional glutamate N-acetyltransferase/amino-acid acetyltransferase ArgJ [Candidatus Omnitrophica bacterium]|nr:bifunctional glutamate N-acetyltransferase/amino-acid acetyltransferase ArgJ [Candidatus Omnitrophota bacterium]